MVKTLTVLSDRRSEIDSLVAAGEVLDMRFVDGKTALSLQAAKLLHRLIAAAGADAGRAMEHSVALASLNDLHHRSKEQLFETVRELFGCSVRLDVLNAKGKRATKIGPLLSDIERDEDDDGELRFELSPVMRRVMLTSNHWAVLSRKAVMAFRSRYSLRLYELVSLRVGLDQKHVEEFSIDDVRALFGVQKATMLRWPDLRRYVLDVAIAEVTHLTGLAVSYTTVKRGRSVIGVRLSWREKDNVERAEAAREIDRSSVGRSARRDGTVETIVQESGATGELAAVLRTLGETVAGRLRA